MLIQICLFTYLILAIRLVMLEKGLKAITHDCELILCKRVFESYISRLFVATSFISLLTVKHVLITIFLVKDGGSTEFTVQNHSQNSFQQFNQITCLINNNINNHVCEFMLNVYSHNFY